MSVHKIMALAVSGAAVGYLIFKMSQGDLHSADGKFLGVIVEDPNTFGLDDVAKGALCVATAMVVGKFVHGMGIPVATVSA